MNAFNDPVGAVLIILALTIVFGLVFTILCAATAVCVRAERWWRNRHAIGSWVNDPAPECRKLADDWRYDFECELRRQWD
jgi:hypothetical protein